jgi:two-component system cell cycle response regulator
MASCPEQPMQSEVEQEQRAPRLLAIDDSPMIHRLLKARLADERLEIHSATNGAHGLESAKALQPDVILLDIQMPEIDGFAVLRELKADAATRDIPVIFLSGASEPESKIRGLDMGAVDFVSKPFDIGELKARVRSALRIRLLIKMLAQRAQIDGLTGLWNRTYFDHRMAEQISHSHRHAGGFALIFCDIDRFKNVNDTHGHAFGDHVLEEFARILVQSRSGDIACRYGGEEFAVILPRTDAMEAAAVAERFRTRLRSVAWPGHSDVVVTASFGVTDRWRVIERTAAAVINSADSALYAAKQAGRDRVELAPVVAQPQEPSNPQPLAVQPAPVELRKSA